MKKHLLNITFILFSLLCCTGCFDIQENVFFKKDGSGTFTFQVDLNDMKSMMSMFANIQPAGEKDEKATPASPYERINSSFEEAIGKLGSIKGISNVHTIEDTASSKFGLAFDFNTVTSLNKAMNKIFQDDTSKNARQTDYFEWKGNELIRHEQLDSKFIVGKTGTLSGSKSTSPAGKIGNIDQLFSGVSYTATYSFEKKISSCQNQAAVISGDKRQISIKCYPFAAPNDSTRQKCTIANTIVTGK